MHCGTGVTMARDGVLAEWLRWVILIASGSLDRAGGMHFHRGVIHRLRRRKSAPAEPGPPSPKSRPELPRVLGQIPAVALTAYGRATDRIRALSAGFQTHVSKPVEPVELAMVIASVAGHAGKGVNV